MTFVKERGHPFLLTKAPFMKLRQNGTVSFLIRLAVFQARRRSCETLWALFYRRERKARRDYLKFSFSAFSARSAVNRYVSFLIRLDARGQGGARALMLKNPPSYLML